MSSERDINITWRPFSLALKNNAFESTDKESPHAKSSRDAHRVLRVMMAAQQRQNKPLIDSYSCFGTKRHTAGFDYDDEWIANVIAELGLPAELIKAADDASYDETLQAELQSAIDVVGKDVGVPTIVFTNDDGKKQGYFGPVILELPEMDEALKLWDGLSNLATVKSFYELKRSRPSGGPNTASTARC